METDSNKCVMIIDAGLPTGLKLNTAGLLGTTLGRKVESMIGPDVLDSSGEIHTGIINIPLPILSADSEAIKGIREKAMKTFALLVVDFTETAQREVRYEDYTWKLATTPSAELKYLGVAIYGPKKLVNKLVGN
ncbi:MAG: DUF2000 domain-containing protein [Candidatus Bathyarchaeia archaeon]|jgi:hypothetical protein